MMPAWLDTLLYEWLLPYIIYVLAGVAIVVWMVQYFRTGISVWDTRWELPRWARGRGKR